MAVVAVVALESPVALEFLELLVEYQKLVVEECVGDVGDVMKGQKLFYLVLENYLRYFLTLPPHPPHPPHFFNPYHFHLSSLFLFLLYPS